DDGGDENPADFQSAISRKVKCSGDHRGKPTLHVLRTTTVETAVFFHRIEWFVIADHADRIHVPAQHQRASLLFPIQHANHVRPAARNFLELDIESSSLKQLSRCSSNLRLPVCAGDQRRIDGIDRNQLSQYLNRRVGHVPLSIQSDRARRYPAHIPTMPPTI